MPSNFIIKPKARLSLPEAFESKLPYSFLGFPSDGYLTDFPTLSLKTDNRILINNKRLI